MHISAYSSRVKLRVMPWWASLSSRTDDIWLRVSLPYYLPDTGWIRKMGFQMALPSTQLILCHYSVKWLLLKTEGESIILEIIMIVIIIPPFLAEEIRINPGESWMGACGVGEWRLKSNKDLFDQSQFELECDSWSGLRSGNQITNVNRNHLNSTAKTCQI